MPKNWEDWDDDDPLRFFVGLRNGCLMAIPMWCLIVFAFCRFWHWS
jgi:hypothetical protein